MSAPTCPPPGTPVDHSFSRYIIDRLDECRQDMEDIRTSVRDGEYEHAALQLVNLKTLMQYPMWCCACKGQADWRRAGKQLLEHPARTQRASEDLERALTAWRKRLDHEVLLEWWKR